MDEITIIQSITADEKIKRAYPAAPNIIFQIVEGNGKRNFAAWWIDGKGGIWRYALPPLKGKKRYPKASTRRIRKAYLAAIHGENNMPC